MAERPRKPYNFKGVGHFEAKCYVEGFRANIYGPLDGDGYTTTLLLEVFTQRNFVADIYSIEIEFYLKKQKSLFKPPFGGFRGNARTPSIALWKACGQLPIRHHSKFFASYILRLRRYKRKSVKVSIFRRVGHFEHKVQKEAGVVHQPLLVS